MSSRVAWLFVLLVLLTGCAAPASTPQPTLQVWRVQRTPSLGWIDETINLCIKEQPQAGIFLDEVSTAEIDPQQADLTLTWGTVAEGDMPVFQLGSDSLALITHPDNSIQSLSGSQLKNITSGSWTTWDEADITLSGEITWWVLPPEDETRLLLEKALDSDLQANPFAWLAPDPAAVLQSVADDPLAIGAIPSRWVNASVKSIAVEGISMDTLTLPILAVTRQQPDSGLTAFLGCLQKNIGQ